MKKLLIALCFALFTLTAQAGGGGGKSAPPSAPPPPPPPPTPQAPSDPNTANAVAREKTRRAQGGGNQSTLLTGTAGAAPGEGDINKPMLGGNTLLGG